MANGEVYWHEGMFLRPHHFLAEHRGQSRIHSIDAKWTLHHNWGLRSIQINTDALGTFRFSVSSLRARMRDGTLVEIPEDGTLADVDLKAALERNRRVTVYLAVPVLKSGQPNVSESGPAPAATCKASRPPRAATATIMSSTDRRPISPTGRLPI